MTLVRRVARWALGRVRRSHHIITTVQAADGWRDAGVAARQHAAYAELLASARSGSARLDLRVGAEAVRDSGIARPSLVEVGCGSGYYSEVLELLGVPVRYLGIDYSASMIALARAAYPGVAFAVGDGTQLPLRDGAADVAFSGNSLMHIPSYAAAVREIARVARRWCVFHSVPVLEKRATTLLRKRAYGVDVVELTFNRAEIESLIADCGLVIRSTREGFPYDLSSVLGERTVLLTYACEKPS